MTKVISLSDRAYGTLKKMKRPNESFSDLVLRMAGEQQRKSILEFAGAWKGDDIDAVFSQIIKDRKLRLQKDRDLTWRRSTPTY